MFLLYAFYDFKLILKVDVKKKVKSTSKMTEYLQQVLIFYNVYVSSTFYFPYLVTKDMDVYDVHKN